MLKRSCGRIGSGSSVVGETQEQYSQYYLVKSARKRAVAAAGRIFAVRIIVAVYDEQKYKKKPENVVLSHIASVSTLKINTYIYAT